MIEITVPLNERNRPESPNKQFHRMVAHNRKKALQRAITTAFLEKGKRVAARKMLEECQGSENKENASEVKKTLLVTICYVRPWGLDKDNLVASLKYAIDSIADNLIPGLAPGRADGDPRLEFDCIQAGSTSKDYKLVITLKKKETVCKTSASK